MGYSVGTGGILEYGSLFFLTLDIKREHRGTELCRPRSGSAFPHFASSAANRATQALTMPSQSGWSQLAWHVPFRCRPNGMAMDIRYEIIQADSHFHGPTILCHVGFDFYFPRTSTLIALGPQIPKSRHRPPRARPRAGRGALPAARRSGHEAPLTQNGA